MVCGVSTGVMAASVKAPMVVSDSVGAVVVVRPVNAGMVCGAVSLAVVVVVALMVVMMSVMVVMMVGLEAVNVLSFRRRVEEMEEVADVLGLGAISVVTVAMAVVAGEGVWVRGEPPEGVVDRRVFFVMGRALVRSLGGAILLLTLDFVLLVVRLVLTSVVAIIAALRRRGSEVPLAERISRLCEGASGTRHYSRV